MRTFYSLTPLIRHADTQLDSVELVTLDIFDTLFVRRMHDPDMVKAPVARFVAEQAARRGKEIRWQRVWELRNEIEAAHRARHGLTHPDFEARYDDYMGDKLARLFDGNPPEGMLDAVADYEMRVESSVIVARAELVAWIKKLHEAGKKIVLVSDIYLPAKYLKRLVAEKQLAPYVTDVISSADSFNAKASGAAWPLIRARFGVEYGRWLHVGDNPHSDGLRPSELGIRSCVIRDVREKQRKGIARQLHYNAMIHPRWKGRYLQQLMLPLEAENEERDPLYTDGYNVFGFLIAFFLHALADACRTRGLERIYFFSREGWLFHECWKRMAPHLFPAGNAPEASYLYVSRVAVSNAACANVGLTPVNAAVALLPAQNETISDICRIFRLKVEALRPLLARHGLTEHDSLPPLPPGEEPGPGTPFGLLLRDADFQAEVRRQGEGTRVALNRYLEQEGFFQHERLALVDIGWLGTIQQYLHDAIRHRSDQPILHGFLLAATRMVPYEWDHGNRSDGLVFDQFRFSLPGSTVLTFKDVLEEVCRAPHPSVIGYALEDGVSRPVLRDGNDDTGRAEHEQSAYYARMHEGIFAAAEQYAAMTTLLGYESRELRPWLSFLLASKMTYPSHREFARIQHRSHQDDFAGKRKVPKRILNLYRSLWDLEPRELRLTPFARTRYFHRHVSRMLGS
jgi:FMN phosphatase YigB (HAD superfamily)